MEKINKLVDLLDLEQSEWIEKYGKIKDIEKLQKYLEEEFVDPLLFHKVYCISVLLTIKNRKYV
jgi:hypothetical protein